jgi:hypothetical protein
MRGIEILNIDKMLTLTRLQVAEHQLEKALLLFLDENDYVSAITLAGASEEILGKLLEKEGKEHAMGSFINFCIAEGKAVSNVNWHRKDFVHMATFFRNSLKHYTNHKGEDEDEVITIPPEAAIEILDRAINNYWSLTGRTTSSIIRFMGFAHGT